jgi:biotin carboxyl carrier protein
MKEFQLRVGDRSYAVAMDHDHMSVEGFDLAWAVEPAGENRFRVAIDGIFSEVELREQEDGQLVAVVDGDEFPVEALGLVLGHPAPPKKEKEVAVPAEPAEGALSAMMPSKVIAVNVQVGDQVQAGQVVLLLEAMKMESELEATQDGTVKAVNCSPGDSVDPGVPLVVIE